MRLFLSFVLLLVAVSPSDENELQLQRGGCPMFWYSFNNLCYKYVASLMTWADAELHCVSQGANLVSIHSLKEENFVKMLIKNFDPAEGLNWIGLTDAQKNNAFIWSDGSKLGFTYWNKGEPNNHGGSESCVHTNWDPPRKWNDVVCTNKYSFVCKSRKVCP